MAEEQNSIETILFDYDNISGKPECRYTRIASFYSICTVIEFAAIFQYVSTIILVKGMYMYIGTWMEYFQAKYIATYISQ